MLAAERRQQSGQAQRRVRAIVERQQQQFQMRHRAIFGNRRDAGDSGQHFLGHDADDVLDLAPAFRLEQR